LSRDTVMRIKWLGKLGGGLCLPSESPPKRGCAGEAGARSGTPTAHRQSRVAVACYSDGLLWFLLAVMAAATTGCGDSSRAAVSLPTPAVRVESVVVRDVPIVFEYVGTLVGYINAQIRARVNGHLVSQNYREGTLVKSGDLLFQADPRPFQTAADQAD